MQFPGHMRHCLLGDAVPPLPPAIAAGLDKERSAGCGLADRFERRVGRRHIELARLGGWRGSALRFRHAGTLRAGAHRQAAGGKRRGCKNRTLCGGRRAHTVARNRRRSWPFTFSHSSAQFACSTHTLCPDAIPARRPAPRSRRGGMACPCTPAQDAPVERRCALSSVAATVTSTRQHRAARCVQTLIPPRCRHSDSKQRKRKQGDVLCAPRDCIGDCARKLEDRDQVHLQRSRWSGCKPRACCC